MQLVAYMYSESGTGHFQMIQLIVNMCVWTERNVGYNKFFLLQMACMFTLIKKKKTPTLLVFSGAIFVFIAKDTTNQP